MPKTIIFHSFHHGVGRSNITANMAFLLAAKGLRVAVIDTDTNSPTLHTLFGLKETHFSHSFNDFLWGQIEIEQAAYNITATVDARLQGQIYLVPASTGLDKSARVLGNPQDVQLLNQGCRRLIDVLNLDALLIDTQPGVSDEALVSITVSDMLIIILRLNPGDFQGTGVTVDLVRRLDVPQIALIVNEAPVNLDVKEITKQLKQAYQCDVAAILPHADEMMALANNDLFVRRYPHHPMTTILSQAAARLVRSSMTKVL
jgi:MinD-like ATPase involved in chromosome partitioning or flagellar assembly